MKKLLIVTLVAAGLVAGMRAQSFASDWDKAGKVFAVTEGFRILTGGAVDILGSITGVKQREHARENRGHFERDEHPRYIVRREFRPEPVRVERIWVPHLVWREKFVPEHSEYKPGYGNIWVGAHYEKYQVEEGGHWEEVYACR
jgi:hypothetical protein